MKKNIVMQRRILEFSRIKYIICVGYSCTGLFEIRENVMEGRIDSVFNRWKWDKFELWKAKKMNEKGKEENDSLLGIFEELYDWNFEVVSTKGSSNNLA